MERIDIKVDDENKVIILLCSLFNSYKSFKETIIYIIDYLTLVNVKNNLLIKFHNDLEFSKTFSLEKFGLFIERGTKKKRNLNSNQSRPKSRHKPNMQLFMLFYFLEISSQGEDYQKSLISQFCYKYFF
jgi:hypothetical protein